MIHHMTEWWKSFPMVPHIVYFDILVTIQRQFINVQYRDASKVENMVRIVGIYTTIAKTAIASLYFQCYNPISYSGHPKGSQKYWLAKMWGCGGGDARGSYLAHGLGCWGKGITNQDIFYFPLNNWTTAFIWDQCWCNNVCNWHGIGFLTSLLCGTNIWLCNNY